MKRLNLYLLVFLILNCILASKAWAQNYFEQYLDSDANYYDITHTLDSIYHSDDSLKTKRGTGYKNYMRWKYITSTRIDEQGSMQSYKQAYRNAIPHRTNQAVAMTEGEGIPQTWCVGDYQSNWQTLGFDQKPSGTSSNNGMGWMHSIWIDKHNPNFILAGSNHGGLWKTTSGGASWFNITGDQIEGMGVRSLAVDPSNNNTILIGAGFGDGGRGASGIWRSTNGGTSCTRSLVQGQPKDWAIRKIVYHPTNYNIVFAIAREVGPNNDYILKSVDGGANFNDVAHGIRSAGVEDGVNYDWSDLEIHLSNTNAVTVWVSGKIAIKSTDIGINYTTVPTSYTYPSGTTATLSISMAITDQNGGRNVMYRVYETRNIVNNVNVAFNNIIEKSVDNGLTWTPKYIGNNGPFFGVSHHKGVFEISKLNTDIVYIGRDYFNYWDDNSGSMYTVLTDPDLMSNIHVDFRDMITIKDGNNEWLYVANDGGMFKAKFADKSLAQPWNWIDINGQGLQVQQIFRATLAKELGRMFTGHQDLSMIDYTLPSNNLLPYSGGSWNHLLHSVGDGGGSVYDKDYPDKIIVTGNTLLYRISSTNSPSSGFTFIGSGRYITQPLMYNPASKNLYAGLGRCKASDAQGNCTLYSYEVTQVPNPFASSYINSSNVELSNIHIPNTPIIELAVSQDEQTMYVAYEATGSNVLYTTTNGGTSWAAINPASSGLSQLNTTIITDIELNPINPQEAWISFGFASNNSGRVFHTTDGGTSFTDVSSGLPSNLPVNELLLDQATASGVKMLYAATDVGVFYMNSGTANTWIPFSNNLPLALVSDLALDKTDNVLIATTYGRGTFYTELPCCIMPASDIVIAQHETWDTDRSIYSEVRVLNGQTLTIQNCDVYMGKDTKIIVEAGGHLIIDGAKLTNNCGPNNTWAGVEVWGDPAQPHTYPIQGWIEMKNGATIENAYNAIYLGQFGNSIRNGGIVNVSNSSFNNNRFGINFPLYTFENTSTIVNCIFDCNRALFQGSGLAYHIGLIDTKGVYIAGCTFRNSAPAGAFLNLSRGWGIRSQNSSFVLDRTDDPATTGHPCDFPDGQGNVFEGLSYGVTIYDYLSDPTRNIFVMESLFKNCQVGIGVFGDGYKKLYNNEFIWDNELIVDDPSALSPFNTVSGIHASQASQLLIEHNTITFDPNFSHPAGNGIYINESASLTSIPSYIYKNDIHHNSTSSSTIYGTFIEGNNPDLFIECNTYDECTYDWYITTQTPDILPAQQGAIGAGTNTFSNCPGGNNLSNIVSNYSFTAYTVNTPTCISGSGTVSISQQPAAVCNNTSPCVIRYEGPITPGTPSDPGGSDGFVSDNRQVQGQDQDIMHTVVKAGTFDISPNPSSDYFTLNYRLTHLDGSYRATIVNTLGETVYKKDLQTLQGSILIETDQWSSGVYYITIECGNTNCYNKKIVLTK